MNIGILVPLSNAHPGISKDFLDGFNSLLTLKQLAGTVTIKKESVGFGGLEKEVYAKAEKLLVSDDVDILIAYIDEKVTGMIYSLAQATGKLVIVVNPGANYPVNWIAQPTVIHLNLQHAFLCWLTGALASAGPEKGGALASSFFDCGYLHSAAMVRHFMESGGTILHNYINNQAYDDNFDIIQLTDFLTFNTDCKNILSVYDESPAALFYDRLNKHKTDPPLHVFVSPMMMTDNALKNNTTGFNFHIEGWLPWQRGIETESNRLFLNTCTRPATIFSLLGWETALVIAEIMTNYKTEITAGEEIIEHLKVTLLHSPRGGMKLDPETHYYTAPAARFRLDAGSTIPQVDWTNNLEKEWKSFSAVETVGTVTGWTNTYLCY